MSRYTEYGHDDKWGKVQVNYGTDRALGYWYDVFRAAPELEIGKTVQGIDIETSSGYVYLTGTMRSIKTFESEHWFERGEKALFETDKPFDFVFKNDENPDYDETEPTYSPASNHLWLGKDDIYADNPIVDRCSTFDGLTYEQWVEELKGYGVLVEAEHTLPFSVEDEF